MRSFASIATFATLAFASVASALPVFNAARTPAVGAAAGVDIGTHHIAPAVDARVVLETPIGEASVDVTPRHNQLSVVEIITQVTTTVTPICQNITDTVSAQNVDVNAVIPVVLNLLGEVLAIVTKAKADIEESISAGVVPLILDGQVLDIKAVAQLVGPLIITIIQCLGIVFKVVGGAHADVLTIVANTGSILAGIITLVLQVAHGLLMELLPIIQPVVPVIASLGLQTVASVFTIVL